MLAAESFLSSVCLGVFLLVYAFLFRRPALPKTVLYSFLLVTFFARFVLLLVSRVESCAIWLPERLLSCFGRLRPLTDIDILHDAIPVFCPSEQTAASPTAQAVTLRHYTVRFMICVRLGLQRVEECLR